MSEQLNFKQVPFDTMYYNNLTKQGGQVLIECDPNRTVLKIIESCITKNNTVLSNAELAQWILRYHVQRTKNHVALVKICATYLKEFFQFGGYFERFIANVQKHDYDKLIGNEHVASFALNAPLYKYKNLYEISPESKRVYEEIEWVKHHQLNVHHPEHYMRRVNEDPEMWAITDEEMEEFFKDKGRHPAALMALGEMVADWAAVGIEMGDTAKEWWFKNKDRRWSYGPKYTQALEACLAFAPEQLFIDQIEPIPDPPKLRTAYSSESSHVVIRKESDINSVADLKEFFSHCKYGIVDTSAGSLRGKTHTHTTEKDYYNRWKLLSPDETIKHKCGVCYDTVLVSKSVFDRLGIKYKLYFAYSNQDEKGNPTYTHTFAIYQDGDMWRWIEGSWGQFKKNDFSSSNSDKLVSRIGKELANAHEVPQQILVLNSYPRPGVTMKEFHDAVMKGSKCCSVNPDKNSDSNEAIDRFFTNNEDDEINISSETMTLLTSTPEEKKLTALAKPLYPPIGKNSWEHIQQDVGNAIDIIRTLQGRDLTLKEYAAILFHDCSVKARKSKDRHSYYSAEMARRILSKTTYFTSEDIDEICQAIEEHDEFINPNGIHSSDLSDLLASADCNPPNVAWILNKSYSHGMENGLTHEERIQNAVRYIPKKYGTHGTIVYPKMYAAFNKKAIIKMQQTFDTLTPEECERIIMDYRRRHGLKEGDLSLPDPSLESISSDSGLESQPSTEQLGSSMEATTTPSKIAQKKKKILDFICKLCDTMEPSGLNSKRYRQIIGQMNDKEFDQFMNYMKEGKWQLHLVAPNMIVNLQNEDLLKACDLIGLDLFQRVWMYDKATGRKFLTDNKYMFVKLPIRRQQQFLDEKISVPDNDRTIDGLTGQVTGDSRSCSITNPEIQILAARGLNNTLQELVNIRGGNIHGYNEFRRMLEENGEGDLDMLDTGSRTRASVVGGKLLQSMMLDTNL